jgi:hypothetical protein
MATLVAHPRPLSWRLGDDDAITTVSSFRGLVPPGTSTKPGPSGSKPNPKGEPHSIRTSKPESKSLSNPTAEPISLGWSAPKAETLSSGTNGDSPAAQVSGATDRRACCNSLVVED